MQRDPATLLDLQQHARLVIEFTAGISYASLLTDAKTRAAVLHEILIVGEAIKRLSQDFRLAHPQVPWKGFAGLRDRLIHGYDDVDFEEVWKTVNGDIPALLQFLEPLLPKEEKH
jgi:uncharacterized protein with HEPN domain